MLLTFHSLELLQVGLGGKGRDRWWTVACFLISWQADSGCKPSFISYLPTPEAQVVVILGLCVCGSQANQSEKDSGEKAGKRKQQKANGPALCI